MALCHLDGPVHVATTTRRYKNKIYTSHLLRRSFRAGKQVKHETLGNLSHLPDSLIDVIPAMPRQRAAAAPRLDLAEQLGVEDADVSTGPAKNALRVLSMPNYVSLIRRNFISTVQRSCLVNRFH